MGKYFSDEQLDEFFKLWLETYPDAIDRAHFIMKHPFRDNDEAMTRNRREVWGVARNLEFFLKYKKDNEARALHHIHHDVFTRVADMLGPIGSYDIEE
jgi:hypothetical protein